MKYEVVKQHFLDTTVFLLENKYQYYLQRYIKSNPKKRLVTPRHLNILLTDVRISQMG